MVLVAMLIGAVSAVNKVTQWNYTNGSQTIQMFNYTGAWASEATLNWTVDPAVTSAEVLIVGGGGGGAGIGAGNSPGGGGGGGVIYISALPITGPLNITVGGGGSAGSTNGLGGGNTTLKLINGTEFKAIGGGGGQYRNDASGTSIWNLHAGSGGGGQKPGGNTSGQGFPGGWNDPDASPWVGGGGGGCAGPGTNANSTMNGTAGSGCAFTIPGFTWYVGGGGAGGEYWTPNKIQWFVPGGGGVNEAGYLSYGINGTGGGGSQSSPGGSGILILRYATPGYVYPPVCSFTATPLSGPAPLTVSVSDTSTYSPTSWNWQLYRPGTGIYSMTDKNWTSPPLEAGNWTINLTATNAGGSCSLSKSGYIYSTGEEVGYVVVNLDVKDAQTGALIQDSAVGIMNTTSGIWRNSTSPTGLVYFDTTGPAYEYPLSLNQSITLAAGGAGYQSASTTFNIPYSNYRVYLYLVRTSVIPVSGTGTVIINVISNKNGVSISGASVVLDTGQIGSTNAAGGAIFLNVTAGNRTVTVSTPTYAYQTTSKVFDLFSGETKFITIQLIMAGETPVPTFQPTAAATTPSDLNTAGTTFLERWAEMAIAFGGLIFLLVFLYFVKKVGK